MIPAADGQPHIDSVSSIHNDAISDIIQTTQHAALKTSDRDLHGYLDTIWQRYFADVPHVNEVEIAWGQPWKTRLGLIRMTLDEVTSFIAVNALLQHAYTPDYLLVMTIAHELAHYAHGFGSPLPRLFAHPHANNVVNRELAQRGLGEFTRLSDEWIDAHWFDFYRAQRTARAQ